MNQKQYLQNTINRINRLMLKANGRDMNLFDAAIALDKALRAVK